jgi:predicted transcriptional regulator of viral defense system
MASKTADRLFDVAVDQGGVFTTSQALREGISRSEVLRALAKGDIRRVARGLYELERFPTTNVRQLWAAVLYPSTVRPEAEPGVISHVSALERILGDSDIAPSKIHVTAAFRTPPRRDVPRMFALHRGGFEPGDVVLMDDGVPTTSAVRTAADLLLSGTGERFVLELLDAIKSDERREAEARAAEAARRGRRDNVGAISVPTE